MNVPSILTKIPARAHDSELIHTIIESPRCHRNKWKYDEKAGLFRLSKILPLGSSFPYDFGFIPSTKGDDGDPLDILVLMDEGAFPGCLITVKLLGVIEAEQTEGKKTTRNDRLIGTAATELNPPEVDSLKELRDERIREIEHFFISYNQVEGREFKPIARHGPKSAERLISDGMRRFKESLTGESR